MPAFPFDEPHFVRQDQVDEVAKLLHDFNTEFDTPTPGPVVLGERLRALTSGTSTWVIVAGDPVAGFAVATLRPNVWFDGPVLLLDELYVKPSLRNQRIGSAIVGFLIEQAREHDVGLVEINVDAPDLDAQRFYERHGFIGVDPDTGERAYYYNLQLAEH